MRVRRFDTLNKSQDYFGFEYKTTTENKNS